MTRDARGRPAAPEVHGGHRPPERCDRQHAELRPGRPGPVKRGVLGNSAKRDEVQARILAHALPPAGVDEPSASLVDLLQADFADGKISCGTQTVRRVEPLRVCFQPFEGRVWICGPDDMRAGCAGCKPRRSVA